MTGIIPISRKVDTTDVEGLTKAETTVFCLLLLLASFAPLPTNSTIGLSGDLSSNGFILLCIGLGLMILSHRHKAIHSTYARGFLILTILLTIITLSMSLYLVPIVGAMYGENPLTTGISTICWLACHAGSIIYIAHCYSKIPLGTLDHVFNFILVFVLVVSLIQVGTIVGVPGFKEIYNTTNLGSWFNLADYRYERLCGVAVEPSGMGIVISMLCFPYAASKLLSTRKPWYGISLALLMFIAYFTYSSTVYITLITSLLSFVVVSFVSQGGRISRGVIVTVMLTLAISLVVGAVYLTTRDFEDSKIIVSVSSLLEKVSDETNQSTAYRTSTVTNDLKIFFDYPLLGVGEGNQGYFYKDNLDASVLNSNSSEVWSALNGEKGVLNGGSFIPSLISGFGLVGTVAYIAWLIFGAKRANERREVMGSYHQMYFMALIGSLPLLWIGVGFSGLPIVFFLVVGMPFITERNISVQGEK